jgi:hypothetical protein
MKAFITQKTDKGNHIVTNAWAAYNFLDNSNYSYIRYKHVHGHGDFWPGQESTSHVESFWGLLNAKIKEYYHSKPANQFMLFVKD